MGRWDSRALRVRTASLAVGSCFQFSAARKTYSSLESARVSLCVTFVQMHVRFHVSSACSTRYDSLCPSQGCCTR